MNYVKKIRLKHLKFDSVDISKFRFLIIFLLIRMLNFIVNNNTNKIHFNTLKIMMTNYLNDI